MDMRQYWGIPGLFLPVGLPEHSSGLTEKETNRKSEKGGERKKREFYYKVYPNNFSTATALSDGTLRRYSIGFLQNLYHCYKNSCTAKRMWQRRNGEDTVCCLEELEAMCFWHSCHSPFEKCIKAIAELVGLSLGTQSRDHHPNLSGEDGGGAAARSGGFEMHYCATS